MDPRRLLRFLRLSETIPIDYMVTGSIASILYGKPRLTHDMDVVVILPESKISAFLKFFDTDEFYCPPEETIHDEVVRGDSGHFNIIDQESGFKVDVYPFSADPLVAWGFQNRRRIEILPGEAVWVAPPEYVILKKLLYFQEGGSQKHLEDIRAILEVSGEIVDKGIIETWVKKMKLDVFWNQV